MVTVSETAAQKLNALIEESGYTTPFVRVSVKGGGCSGLSYDLSFDTEQQPTDTLAEDKGVKILVDMKSLLYLYGTELEFSGGLNGKGFQFINPNASRTCGCGESFAL
jgi:iron-sulfur cluster assembly protein